MLPFTNSISHRLLQPSSIARSTRSRGARHKWLKLATKQLKGPKLLRKKFNQEGAAFWRGAKSGFLVKLSLMGLFDETFSKSFCQSPPIAAEGGFGGGRRPKYESKECKVNI